MKMSFAVIQVIREYTQQVAQKKKGSSTIPLVFPRKKIKCQF